MFSIYIKVITWEICVHLESVRVILACSILSMCILQIERIPICNDVSLILEQIKDKKEALTWEERPNRREQGTWKTQKEQETILGALLSSIWPLFPHLASLKPCNDLYMKKDLFHSTAR